MKMQKCHIGKVNLTYLATILILCCIAFGLFVIYGYTPDDPLSEASPTLKVDYVAKLNDVTKPINYDLINNAAPLYSEVLSDYQSLPDSLKIGNDEWPVDLAQADIDGFREWFKINQLNIEKFMMASEKPFCWTERHSDIGSLFKLSVPFRDELRTFTLDMVIVTKYQASLGNIDEAIDFLISLNKLGLHRIKGTTYVEQGSGAGICHVTCNALLMILNYCAVSDNTLSRLLNELKKCKGQLMIPRFALWETYYGMDCIQHCFTDDENGNGQLIPKRLENFRNAHRLQEHISYSQAIRICRPHPDRKQTTELFNQWFKTAQDFSKKTPWEINQKVGPYDKVIDKLIKDNYFLQTMLSSLHKLMDIGWQTELARSGTSTVTAILLYKSKNGHLPESLNHVVESGCLDELPIDSYSGQPLIYRKTNNSFILYSVGSDMVNDGGMPFLDRIFGPVETFEK